MKTNEQRIADLHQRVRQLRRRQEKTVLSCLASLCLLLSVLLVWLMYSSAGHSGGISDDAYTAASLLDESIGGYVLAGVIGAALAWLLAASRRKEIALMRALGTPNLRIILNFLFEHALLCLVVEFFGSHPDMQPLIDFVLPSPSFIRCKVAPYYLVRNVVGHTQHEPAASFIGQCDDIA